MGGIIGRVSIGITIGDMVVIIRRVIDIICAKDRAKQTKVCLLRIRLMLLIS